MKSATSLLFLGLSGHTFAADAVVEEDVLVTAPAFSWTVPMSVATLGIFGAMWTI
jgi:hypothetical protein